MCQMTTKHIFTGHGTKMLIFPHAWLTETWYEHQNLNNDRNGTGKITGVENHSFVMLCGLKFSNDSTYWYCVLIMMEMSKVNQDTNQ